MNIQLFNQSLSGTDPSALDATNTLMAISRPKSTPVPSGDKPRQTTRRKHKKKGGYPTRSVLLPKEVRQIRNMLKLLRDHGVGPNVLISVNLPVIDGETDAHRKHRIGKRIAYVRRILERKDCQWFGFTIYEYPKDGTLHAHHSVYVPKHVLPLVQKWIAGVGIWDNTPTGERHGYDVHGCPYDRFRHDSYLVKEAQLPCPPSEWKKSALNRFRPRAGRPLRGKRLQITADVWNILKRPV